MKASLLFLFFCFTTNLTAQEGENPLPYVQPKEMYDIEASYPRGQMALQRFLEDNLKYPEPEKTKGLQGYVVIKFIITKKGKIENITTINGVAGAPNFVKESIRLVTKMPKWIPAKLKNKAIESEYYLNIPFSLK